MDWTIYKKEAGYTGYIDKKVLSEIPEWIKEEFLNKTIFKDTNGSKIEFEVPDDENAETLIRLFKNYVNNRRKRSNRIYSLYNYSNGIYAKEDLDAIYEIQEGKCYYSGEPLDGKYSIDHIIPVIDEGSSWPINIALCLSLLNSQKRDTSKAKFMNKLERSRDKEWRSTQSKFQRVVNNRRRVVDRKRRQSVSAELLLVEQVLKQNYPDLEVLQYSLSGDQLVLIVEGHYLELAPGFIREPEKALSPERVGRIIETLI